jgi:aspartate aminotransferase-like enzyme
MEEEVLSLLQKFLYTSNDVVVVFGTGTSGIEASLNSILEPGDKFMIVHNGMFGEIMSLMTRAVGALPVVVPFKLGTPICAEAIDAALDDHPDVKGIGVVHGETSVGVANPLKEVGDIARKRDLLYVVDAVSSFASETLLIDEWNVDVCVVNGQKCLGAPQGNSFVSVSERAWKKIKARKEKIRGFYMNLLACKDYLDMARTEQQNWSVGANRYEFNLREAPHPASPSFVIMKGMWAALKQLEQEGIDASINRHETAGMAVRAAVKAMGLHYICQDDSYADNAVTAVLLPQSIEDYGIRRHLFERYGVIFGDANMMSWNVYKSQIGKNYVRFGTMGEAAHYHKVLYAVFALGMTLRDLGEKADVSRAVSAVQDVYQKEGEQ